MVKNPPSSAGDAGSIPGQRTKIPHAAGQLSPCAATTELARLNERAHVPPTTEPTRPGARAPQLESLRAATKIPQLRPNAAKNKINKYVYIYTHTHTHTYIYI